MSPTGNRPPAPGRGDSDRVNDVIASVKGPMLEGAAARFDPGLALLDLPLPAIAGSDAVDLIGMWRNQALDKGIGRSQVTIDEDRRAFEGEIEREAMAIAAPLLNAGTSRPSPVSPAERDAHCESARP